MVEDLGRSCSGGVDAGGGEIECYPSEGRSVLEDLVAQLVMIPSRDRKKARIQEQTLRTSRRRRPLRFVWV